MSNDARGVRDRETRALIKHAVDHGWTVEIGSHIKLRSPSGELVVTGASPSDRRAHLNLRSILRKKGLDV